MPKSKAARSVCRRFKIFNRSRFHQPQR
jgi:ribosomal protein L35